MSSSSRRVALSTCSAPDRLRRGAGQRHVDAVRAPACARAHPRASSPARAAISASSAWRAWLAALPTAPRCSGASVGDLAQHLRQLGLAAEVAHAQLLERIAARRLRDRRLGLAAQLLDPLDHDAGTLDGLRVISYSATVAAIAAFSDSLAIGMRATRSHARRPLGRQAVALGADQQRHGAVARAHLALQRLAASRHERDALARAAPRSPATRASATREDRAHARAHRLRRVRVRAAGPERDARGAEGLGGAQHRADVAGVADAVQVHAQRAPRPLPTAARRPRSRACPSRARRRPPARRARRRGSSASPRPEPARR